MNTKTEHLFDHARAECGYADDYRKAAWEHVLSWATCGYILDDRGELEGGRFFFVDRVRVVTLWGRDLFPERRATQ